MTATTRWERLTERLDLVDEVSRQHSLEDPSASASADQAVAATVDVLGLYGVDARDLEQLYSAGAGAVVTWLTGVGMYEQDAITRDELDAIQTAAFTIAAAVARLAPEANTPRSWTIEHPDRPWTLNGERKGSMSHYERAALVRGWREAFAYRAKAAKVPRLDRIVVTATPILANNVAQDTAGCFPAAKAAIDGLVDARVITDDGPDVVRSLTFNAPVLGAGRDALQLTIQEAPQWNT